MVRWAIAGDQTRPREVALDPLSAYACRDHGVRVADVHRRPVVRLRSRSAVTPASGHFGIARIQRPGLALSLVVQPEKGLESSIRRLQVYGSGSGEPLAARHALDD